MLIDKMTNEQDWQSIKLGFELGFYFAITYLIMCNIFRKKALSKIKSKLEEGEFISCIAKHNIGEAIMPFSAGGFLGTYVITFINYPELVRVDTLPRESLPLCIGAVLFLILFSILVSCWECVFTNKRMINGWAFMFLYKLKGSFYNVESLYYSDTKKIEYKYYFWFKALYLLLNTNKYFRIPGFKNLEEIKMTIEKYT